MKYSIYFFGLLAISIALLAMLEYLGVNTKFPRGFVMLTIFDLAIIKVWMLVQIFKEFTK